jgi:hypothetical protein
MEEGHFYNEQDLIEACKRGHVGPSNVPAVTQQKGFVTS